MEKKMTKSEFRELCTTVLSETVLSANKQGGGNTGIALMLTGALLISEISTKLFENEDDTLIITDKED